MRDNRENRLKEAQEKIAQIKAEEEAVLETKNKVYEKNRETALALKEENKFLKKVKNKNDKQFLKKV